jgi:hypothetical protein
VDPDAEAKAREIVLAAQAQRKRLPRSVWIAALVIGALCAGAVAIAWWQERDTVSNHPLTRAPVQSSGLGMGLLLGLGIGVAIGAIAALRARRDR